MEKDYLIEELSQLPPMVLETAYLYGFHYANYGVDVTKAWTTAIQQAYMVQQVQAKTRHDTMEEMINNRRGHWVYTTDTHGKCSKCEMIVPLGNFCGHCGALMEEDNGRI